MELFQWASLKSVIYRHVISDPPTDTRLKWITTVLIWLFHMAMFGHSTRTRSTKGIVSFTVGKGWQTMASGHIRPSTCFCKSSFSGLQGHPFISVLSPAACVLQQQSYNRLYSYQPSICKVLGKPKETEWHFHVQFMFTIKSYFQLKDHQSSFWS